VQGVAMLLAPERRQNGGKFKAKWRQKKQPVSNPLAKNATKSVKKGHVQRLYLSSGKAYGALPARQKRDKSETKLGQKDSK
jgi:hypothetical protein